MEYLTTVELSERWNITSRRIGVLCAEGLLMDDTRKIRKVRCNTKQDL